MGRLLRALGYGVLVSGVGIGGITIAYPGLLEGTARGTQFVGTCGMLYGLTYSVEKYHRFMLPGESDESIQEKMKPTHRYCAKKLLSMILGLRGVFVKVGQAFSLSQGLLPVEYADELSVLRDCVPSMPFEVFRDIFISELGKTPEELFESIDLTPFAAASLAQVHKGKLRKDGVLKDVAIKLQYPQVAKFFESDMKAAQFITQVVLYMNEGIDVDERMKKHWDDRYERMKREYDFLQERNNSRRCAENFKGDDAVYVPTVFDDLSSKSILTMEFIDGVSCDNVPKLKEKGFDISVVAKLIFESFSKQVFVHGFIHSDLHPGNIFVRNSPSSGKPQIVLLDHGLYTELDDSFRVAFTNIFYHTAYGNQEEAIKLSQAAGIEHPELFTKFLLVQSLDAMDVPSIPKDKEDRQNTRSSMLSLPPSLALVFRSMFYLRSLNRYFGVPVDRFRIMARAARQEIALTYSLLSVLTLELRLFWFRLQALLFKAVLYFNALVEQYHNAPSKPLL